MFKKVLEYAGEYRKTTYASMAVMLIGIVMNVLPFLFLYQLMEPLLLHRNVEVWYVAWRVLAIGVCGVLYALFYVKGLALSHRAAYKTLRNLRSSLQGKLERQPLGTIQEKGVGTLKKMFIDDIDSIELLLAHALPEGLSNVAVPLFVFIAMFFVDWKLALLSLCALPLGLIAMGAMYQAGTSKMGAYYASAQKMNNTIVEYINGMEVVKVFNRDGESYKRFEQDVRGYRDFTLAWYRVCWPWMALYNSILPCLALFTLPIGAYLVLSGASTLPDLALVLCMSFGAGAPLLRALSFMSTLPQINYKITALEQLMNAPALEQKEKPFTGKGHSISFENVRFAYKEDEVLHGVSLTVPESSLTALVGESGSGKSTLAKLLVHYYDVTGGSIQVGGQDLREMSVEALNDQISYVSQEQFLFNMSLLENIRLGKSEATDEEVLAAAEKAQCMGISRPSAPGHPYHGRGRRQTALRRGAPAHFPGTGYSEGRPHCGAGRGHRLHGPGERRKNERGHRRDHQGKTVIVIAHRLHSIVNADQICVLDTARLRELAAMKSCWKAARNTRSCGGRRKAAPPGALPPTRLWKEENIQ